MRGNRTLQQKIGGKNISLIIDEPANTIDEPAGFSLLLAFDGVVSIGWLAGWVPLMVVSKLLKAKHKKREGTVPEEQKNFQCFFSLS